MKIQTSALEGRALDWGVVDVLGRSPEMRGSVPCCESSVLAGKFPVPEFCSRWSDGGLLIEAFGVWLSDDADDEPQGPWIASIKGGGMVYGRSPLVAACRAIVLNKAGSEVEVPDELLEE